MFLCIKSPVGVCVAGVWPPTIGHLCLFQEGGSLETWRRLVIGWLVSERSLLWRVLHGFWGFFLLPFQLNVECGTLKGHSEFVQICVCVFVCFHRLLLFFFFLTNFTQRSLTKNQAAARPVSQLGWDLLSFYLYLLSWPFKIKGGYKKINKSLFSVKNLMWEITHECLQPPFPRAPVDRRTPNVWVPERTSELCKPRNRSETAHISTCTLMWQRGNERIWT